MRHSIRPSKFMVWQASPPSSAFDHAVAERNGKFPGAAQKQIH